MGVRAGRSERLINVRLLRAAAPHRNRPYPTRDGTFDYATGNDLVFCLRQRAQIRRHEHARTSLRVFMRRCLQAIAKTEAVRGSAALPVRAPTLCLCKTPREERLAARMLLVRRRRVGVRSEHARNHTNAIVSPGPVCLFSVVVPCGRLTFVCRRSRVTIGDFSRGSHLSVKTLRHYHEVGLLEPSEVDPDNGHRYYSTTRSRSPR